MPFNQRHNNNNRNTRGKPKLKDSNAAEIDSDNPILACFQAYALELDDKHDRYERIVKLSRDITIESKRIIFLLHTIDGRKGNKDKVLQDAQQRLNKLLSENFKAIAKELQGQDTYQYRHAYSPGLQEFIEAYTFMEHLRNNANARISDWQALQQLMQYEEEVQVEKPTTDEVQQSVVEHSTTDIIAAPVKKKFEFFVDPTEYILGVADLTGELMRRCINSLGSGETAVCIDTCKALQQYYVGYLSLHVHRCRELSRKIYTMRQSLLKTENVCYNVKVRGGEAAKWGAVFDNKPGDDVDEGFF